MSGIYVNADTLRKRMMLLQEHDGRYLLTHEVFNTIWDTPLADVRENVHGEWTQDGNCSVCGYGADPITVGSNFCPHCGADMRKGETNG